MIKTYMAHVASEQLLNSSNFLGRFDWLRMIICHCQAVKGSWHYVSVTARFRLDWKKPWSFCGHPGDLLWLHHIFRCFCEWLMLPCLPWSIAPFDHCQSKLYFADLNKQTWHWTRTQCAVSHQREYNCVVCVCASLELLWLDREVKPGVVELDNCVNEAWHNLGFGPFADITLPDSTHNFTLYPCSHVYWQAGYQISGCLVRQSSPA